MGRPWKRIALDFVVGVTALLAARQLRRLEAATDDGRTLRLRPGRALAGALSSAGWLYASDADVGGIREHAKTTYSVTVGTGLETLCYRLRYGVVRPRRAGSGAE